MKVLTKQYWSDAGEFTHSAANGLVQFVEAASLTVSAVYAGLTAVSLVDPNAMSTPVRRIVLVACIIIAMRGSVELLKYFARKGTSNKKK